MLKILNFSAGIFPYIFILSLLALSSKYFTQIHCLFTAPRKTNNVATFIVSLKQNNSEGFTTKWFFDDSKFAYKTNKFCAKCPRPAELWRKKPTSISEKNIRLCYVGYSNFL